MSGTAPEPGAAPSQQGAVVTSIIAQVTFIGALLFSGYLAWSKQDTASVSLFTALAGMAGSKAGTVIDYWLGSARGSQAKDVTIAALAGSIAPAAAPTAPGTTP